MARNGSLGFTSPPSKYSKRPILSPHGRNRLMVHEGMLVRDLLRYPIIMDGRNLLRRERMKTLGIMYFSMGRPMSGPRTWQHPCSQSRLPTYPTTQPPVRRSKTKKGFWNGASVQAATRNGKDPSTIGLAVVHQKKISRRPLNGSTSKLEEQPLGLRGLISIRFAVSPFRSRV